MSENEIPFEYLRSFSTSDEVGHLDRLRRRRELARLHAGTDFGTVIKATFALEDRDPTLAIELCTDLIETPQSDDARTKPEAHLIRGFALARKGDIDAEITDFTAVIHDSAALAIHKWIAHIFRGVALSKKGDTEAARADFTAVTDDPAAGDHRAQAFINRGITFADNGDPEAALADFTAATDDPATTPEHRAHALFNRGATFRRMGNTEAADADYTAVIDDPATTAAQRAMARIQLRHEHETKGDTTAEIADLTALIDDPAACAESKAAARLLRGMNLSKRHETREAIDDFQAVVKDVAAPAILRTGAQLYWMLSSQDPSGKLIDAANVLEVELDEETKREFHEKLHTERERKKAFFGKSQFREDGSFLLVAREWNSFTPAVPELGEPSRGRWLLPAAWRRGHRGGSRI